MTKWLVERRLSGVGQRLRSLREELAVIDEQLAQLADEADDARIRSLVSETPLAEREHHEAERRGGDGGPSPGGADVDRRARGAPTPCSTS